MTAAVNSDLIRLVPSGATHVLVEERMSRGQVVFAVTAIVPDGAAVVLNGYCSSELATSTADALNVTLAGRKVA